MIVDAEVGRSASGGEVLVVDALQSACLMTHRETFNAVGGFDEQLRHLYDLDLSVRARNLGQRLLCHSAVFALHEETKQDFRTQTLRVHDWLYATPSVWAKTSGESRPLTMWEAHSYWPALYPRHRVQALAARHRRDICRPP